MDAKLRDVRAEFDRICASAGAAETDERDPTTQLNWFLLPYRHSRRPTLSKT
jgi:hypothetical protein